jgi:hypothetical protein
MINSSEMRKPAILFMAVLLTCTSHAQVNFLPGYIIPKDEDTIHGLIDYRNWTHNPESISFKSGDLHSPTVYTPNDIYRFSVHGEIYQSAQIELETSPRATKDLENNAVLNLSSQRVFLQVLFEGEKNLYYFRTRYGIENFYIGKVTAPVLLQYKRYLKLEEGYRDLIAENKQYLGQLTYYLEGGEKIITRIADTSYDRRSIEMLFNYYYNSSGIEPIYFEKPEKVQFKFGLAAGYSRAALNLLGESPNYLEVTEFEPSDNIAAAMYLEFIFPRKNGRWSLYNELQYSSYLFSGEYVRFDQPDYYSGYVTKLGASYFKISNAVRFNQSLGKIIMFLGAGIANDFSFAVTNSQQYIAGPDGGVLIRENPAFESYRIHQESFVFDTGIKYAHFSLEGRFQMGNGMSTLISLRSKTRMFSVLLGYSF